MLDVDTTPEIYPSPSAERPNLLPVNMFMPGMKWHTAMRG